MFRAMGTAVAVVVPGLAGDAARALEREVVACFADAERRFSRFLPDSELARLNRAAGPFVASAPLFDALARAQAYARATGGLFDPGVGGALAALGYDRPFAPGALDRAGDRAAPVPGSVLEVALDAATRTVRRPAHVTLDLGGMIKGATVDRAAALLPAAGAVDAGGDLALRGDGEAWLVDVEDPADAARTCCTLVVRGGAVATSAANRRRWRAGGEARHHLIDPRRARPAATDLAQVTVLAPRAERAEVLAKAAFVAGRARGAALLAAEGLAAVLVGVDGTLTRVGDPEVRDA